MSGHSKWATIKRKKEATDNKRGALFTKLARDITVAARKGGGDPDGNFYLKTAIQKAKEANLPNENIQRAIKKGTGELGGSNYEELNYEGYGPGGVAVLLEVETDNRNRTASDIRHIFSKCGGNMGEVGCVSWMFDKKGQISIDNEDEEKSEDELMLMALDAGAEDMEYNGDSCEIFTAPDDLDEVTQALEVEGLKILDSTLTMIPQSTVALSGKEAQQMLRLIDMLEEHDDVGNVYANFDISEEEMAQM